MTEQRRKSKQFNFRLDEALAGRFEEYCNGRGLTLTQFFENSIRLAIGEPLTIPQEALGYTPSSSIAVASQNIAPVDINLADRVAELEETVKQMASRIETLSNTPDINELIEAAIARRSESLGKLAA